ncbi:MAG TPA: glycogen debranching protein GlgX [Ilumatobacteraceae bacterium]|nr:glycogen debranching protein GlgX [Ilumatobacteraceae bacterium]HRB01859.1 glycogen debranching protein GlgX [Ilumatobacteraceae bacterium]
MRVWPGVASPLGATFDGVGTNIAVFSDVAERIELCVFDDDGAEERYELPERAGAVWHGYFPDLAAGSLYGFRVHGPWDPGNGQRCNPHKLLLDPYALAIEGDFTWNQSAFSYQFDDPATTNDDDDADAVPRSVVVNPFFDWGTDQPLRLPWSETVIYEAHVRGATMRHPDVDEELRGTYAGIAHPAFINHLTSLGITTLELLPVHEFAHDAHLVERGLRNYWGYNSIGFLAPHHDYSHRHGQGQQVQDFKQMVKTLHQAGIEVILDVVYNHTAEGNHLGPTLSFKGIDNAAYYRLMDDDKRYYMDYTGTGNTLNMRNPFVLQLVMDSLRYWATEMHVDGFRFDLASTLARTLHEVDKLSAFFDLVQQDPVVSRLKLIAEPWDVGEGGYQVGNFPPQWAEWNGRYRDCIRDHWAGAPHTLGEFANRITGSSDLYEAASRKPHASINFVTAHDGFTLRDLVSYNDKHNEANGEDNNDGESHNRGWNCGVEGPTDDEAINTLRARQQRNQLTTLLLSQGVPMILGGDELGRTQSGNNNAYCQDNEISWYDWDNPDHDLLDFVTRLIALRRDHPTFRRRQFFQGKPLHGDGAVDLAWFATNGQPMADETWDGGDLKTVTVFIGGQNIDRGPRGEQITDTDFLWLINASTVATEFTIPDVVGSSWSMRLDTSTGFVDADPAGDLTNAGDNVSLVDRSIVLLERVATPPTP